MIAILFSLSFQAMNISLFAFFLPPFQYYIYIYAFFILIAIVFENLGRENKRPGLNYFFSLALWAGNNCQRLDFYQALALASGSVDCRYRFLLRTKEQIQKQQREREREREREKYSYVKDRCVGLEYCKRSRV